MPTKWPTFKPGAGIKTKRYQPPRAALRNASWRDGKTTVERGYGSRWRRERTLYLAQHPLCCMCTASGRTTAATVVDHIEPHRGDEVLFWDHGNWQALCAACHNRKTAKQDGGFGRVAKR